MPFIDYTRFSVLVTVEGTGASVSTSILMREKLQASIVDLKWTHTGIWRALFAEKPEWADSLIYCTLSSGRPIWVKTEKQWVFRYTFTTCPVLCSRLWDLCTSLWSLSSPSSKCHCSSVIRYKVAGLLVLVFLRQCASPHLGASEMSHRKKKIQCIWRLTLKSADNVSIEIKCYVVDNEFSHCAFPSKKKKNNHL